MNRLIMDSNYWIDLKKNPELFREFYDVTSEEDVKVILSYGNFIDFVKADEQDVLSKIIVGIADYCLPATPISGNEYPISGNPLDLIPNDEFRQFATIQTRHLDMVETLQYVFRSSDWEPVDEFHDSIEQYRDLCQEYGYEQLKGYAFREHLHEEGDSLVLYQQELDIVEYVKGEIYLQRFDVMDKNENADSHDVADLEICTQALLSDCNMLLLESKWVNLEFVDRVAENVEADMKPAVYDDIEDVITQLRSE